MNIRVKPGDRTWIGLAKVKAMDFDVLGANFAWVQAMGPANGRTEFRRKIKAALSGLQLDLLRLEEAAMISGRKRQALLSEGGFKPLGDAKESKEGILFSVFHTYEQLTAYE